MKKKTLFATGASGFIGREVVKQAIKDGFVVKGLVRSLAGAQIVTKAGGHPAEGDADHPEAWIDQAKGASVFIDLVQLPFPARLSSKRLHKMAAFRLASVKANTRALLELHVEDRPAYFFFSGAGDLQPDATGRIDHHSSLCKVFHGDSAIGIPVRRHLENSKIDATYIYFGNMVYGPGKGFANTIVPGLAKGKHPIIGAGKNHFPLTHVTDAARAVTHIASLAENRRSGKTFIATDGGNCTQYEFISLAAELMGAPKG